MVLAPCLLNLWSRCQPGLQSFQDVMEVERSTPKLTHMVVVRLVSFMPFNWGLEVFTLPVGLSIGILTTWQLAYPSTSDSRKRKKPQGRCHRPLNNLFSEVKSHYMSHSLHKKQVNKFSPHLRRGELALLLKSRSGKEFVALFNLPHIDYYSFLQNPCPMIR